MQKQMKEQKAQGKHKVPRGPHAWLPLQYVSPLELIGVANFVVDALGLRHSSNEAHVLIEATLELVASLLSISPLHGHPTCVRETRGGKGGQQKSGMQQGSTVGKEVASTHYCSA